MDPITIGLLAALAGGAGGELGRQAWAGLGALVRRPFRNADDSAPPADADAVPGSGVAEFAALEAAPADRDRADALRTALARRAATDPGFGADLARWHENARLVGTGDGGTHNRIGGGTFQGPVLQGRDFSGLTFTTPPPPAAGPATEPGGTEDR
ncbi:hypothetical protein [Embleya sp. NPDC020630]|uniref:hypothetical protein n=1 Tax=Embleya sp. NPDC020630 TaxID=3363979 RepID=UPI00378F313C